MSAHLRDCSGSAGVPLPLRYERQSVCIAGGQPPSAALVNHIMISSSRVPNGGSCGVGGDELRRGGSYEGERDHEAAARSRRRGR
jgi:hypothetical protein